jgi:predicted nucleic acid-binding Zn ribbon protein
MRRPFSRIPPLGPPRQSPRQKALAEWRGTDLRPLEEIRERPAQPVRQVMEKVLTQRLHLEQKQGEAEIVRVWDSLIDPTLVAHARPTGLAKGTLFVSVDSSVWLDEIVRYRRKEILERLQTSFGRSRIVRISFRVG